MKLNDKIIEIPIGDIIPYEGAHNTDAVVDMLSESLKQYGFQQPLILDKNMNIVCGNGVYKAALKNGIEKVPCMVLDYLTDDEIAQYRIADNKTSEFARWNEKKLKKELSYLQSPDSLQFCFDENIKNMLGLSSPIFPVNPKKENSTTQQQQVLNEEQKAERFRETLRQIDKGLEAKPREYFEYVCSSCGKKVTIKV